MSAPERTMTSRRIAILQPNYIPWKGVFDLIHQADVFVFLDDAQYTPRDWRNRNAIKTLDGSTRWLSVPVGGGRDQRICDVAIDNSQAWQRKHIEALRHSYGGTPFYSRYAPRFAEVLGSQPILLADLDIQLTLLVCEWLGLKREFFRSTDLGPQGAKDERLIDLVKKVGGTDYLSGPAAMAYIRPELFSTNNIGLEWIDYSGYPAYPQISHPFQHAVTILDLLFAVGPEAPAYIWGRNRARRDKNVGTSVLENG